MNKRGNFWRSPVEFFVAALITLSYSPSLHAQANPAVSGGAAQQQAGPHIPPPLPPQAGAVTQGELLSLSKMVLDYSKEQGDHARENLTWFMSVIAGLAAILAFFGVREFQSMGKPYKEKLDVLKKDYEDKLDNQIKEFQEKSHNNARALVASQLTWNYLEDAKKPSTGNGASSIVLFKAVVEHVNDAVPADYDKKLDPYLAGLLLMRKAFALKRLGDNEGAYLASAAALKVDGETSRGQWAYNAACYAALTGRLQECCLYLSQAVQLEPSNGPDALKDPDFIAVQNEPAFIAIVKP